VDDIIWYSDLFLSWVPCFCVQPNDGTDVRGPA